ncbi:protein kinase [Streptomyces sp. MS1.HAVA.3]|uniref:non-specific serine/threonine protein kinase n=1 Tax=Streptomyces caledonius TaxID=3134107 RepID=A0ABU8U7W8_9ACTN
MGAQGPQLIDFGIARGVGATELTQDGQAPGTPGYTAPEVLLGAEAGAAADVFALGATLAYAATGRPPFGTGVAATVSYRAVHEPVDVAGVEPGLAALIEACVAKDPAARPDPAEVIRRCGVRDALVDDPVYVGLEGLGEAVPVHEMRTQGPGYLTSHAARASPAAGRPAARGLDRRRGGGRRGGALAGGVEADPPRRASRRGRGRGREGRCHGRAARGGRRADPGAGASTGGAKPPAEYIEDNQVSRYLWTASSDPAQAAHGVGQCNQPAERSRRAPTSSPR